MISEIVLKSSIHQKIGLFWLVELFDLYIIYLKIIKKLNSLLIKLWNSTSKPTILAK